MNMQSGYKDVPLVSGPSFYYVPTQFINFKLIVIMFLMPRSAMFFSLIFLVMAHAVSAQEANPCPAKAGAYLKIGATWTSLDAVHSIGFKTTGIAKMAFSYGAAAAKVKAQFRDSKSPYQLPDANTAICLVNLIDNGRDLTLAKFQEEKDHRELQMASLKTFSGVNAQIDPKAVIPIDVKKVEDRVYLVITKEPIPRGEFILFLIVPDVQALAKANTPQALGGYDFGNHNK